MVNRFPTGNAQWLKAYLYDRWQRVRRHPDFLAFCEKHNFNEKGILEEQGMLDPESQEIMDRFGLEIICHPSADLPEDHFLDWPIFKDALAVEYEYREEAPDLFTPIWDDRYIKLKINISPTVKWEQVKSEVKEFWEGAQQLAAEESRTSRGNDGPNKSEREHLHKRREYYEIWDDRKARKPFGKIAQKMGLKRETTKKRFYKAFELIMGIPYNQEELNHIPVTKVELRKTCKTCSDKECEKEFRKTGRFVPCPDVAAYCQQDQVEQKEFRRADPFLLYSEDRDED